MFDVLTKQCCLYVDGLVVQDSFARDVLDPTYVYDIKPNYNCCC